MTDQMPSALRMLTPLLLTSALASCALEATDVDTATADQAATTSPVPLGWSDDVQIANQQSARQPALAYYGGKTFLVHAGSSYPTELWWSAFDGTSWSPNAKISGQSADGSPALAAYNNTLFMAYKPAGQNKLVVTTTTNGSSWSTPVTEAAGASGTDANGSWSVSEKPYVSLAVHGGKLYMAYCEHVSESFGSTDRLEIDRYDGTAWTGVMSDVPWSSPLDCTGVSLSSFGGSLHLIFNDYISDTVLGITAFADTSLYEIVFDPDNLSTWPAYPTYLWMDSTRPASVAVCGNYAYLVHSGQSSPGDIWSSTRETSSTSWPTNAKLTNQTSDGGAAVGCYGSTAIMVHNGGTNQLWWAHVLWGT